MFVVPASEGSKKENRFEFKIGQKKYSVPFIQFLSGEGAEFLDDQGGRLTEAVLARRLLVMECPEAGEAVRSLAADQATALSRAWVEASTASAGESLASDDS